MRPCLADSDRLHCVWWVVNAASERIEQYEVQLMIEIDQLVPVLLVLTHCDMTTEDAISEVTQHIPQHIKILTVILQESK